MAQKKSQGKAKAKPTAAPTAAFAVNPFEAIQAMDGNPNSPAEFDESPHDDEEMYFVPSDEATEAEKDKCKVLNYIHRRLKYNTRRVPPPTVEGEDAIEIYHRETYNGVSYDVCVIFPTRVEGGFKECIALVKLTSNALEDDESFEAVVTSDAAWTAQAQKDKFTLVVDKLSCNYWAPRWKYVVKYLRDRMATDFDKHGFEVIPEVESDVPRGSNPFQGGAGGGVTDSGEIIEEVMQVFSGATGKIIGPKGSKIHEIKDATHVDDIKMPAKSEDGSRPKARELVDVTIKGTRTQIDQAKVMIQAVVDEWANAPRPPRDGGYTAQADFNTESNTFNNDQGGSGDSGEAMNWADDANNEAEWAGASGGAATGGGNENWGASGGAAIAVGGGASDW